MEKVLIIDFGGQYNQLIARRVKGIPMLNLVLDSQTGTAGVETRLESFIDIIRLKEGKL
jgi:GMP synthase-like glutamine amidotransferase